MMTSIEIISRYLALSLWAVVGFLFWIPLLLKVVAANALLIFLSAFTKSNYGYEQNSIDEAANFYLNGFRKILGHRDVEKNIIGFDSFENINFNWVWVNVVWTILFWSLLGFVLFDF